jgi:hypothetical protein
MADGPPLFYNADLLHTSSWVNTYLDRDHHAPDEQPAGNPRESSGQKSTKPPNIGRLDQRT